MGFSNAQATSWPSVSLPGTSLTLRANTDAGIVFVVGTLNNSSATAVNGSTPLAGLYRPLAQLVVYDTSFTVGLLIDPAGNWHTGAVAGNFTFRTFFFTTVIPG